MALALDQTARRYGKTPSELVRVRDPWLALDLDLAIATRARAALRDQLDAILSEDEGGGFFAAVIALLSE